MEEKEESQGFKVVDKRRFGSDGSESEVSKPVQEVADKNVTGEKIEKKEETFMPPQEINFSAFLMGVYTQTLIFLGDIPHPETNLLSSNLEAAQQNIAVLSIIEEKTKGNLTPEEEHLFKEILTTVRLQFVKKAKS